MVIPPFVITPMTVRPFRRLLNFHKLDNSYREPILHHISVLATPNSPYVLEHMTFNKCGVVDLGGGVTGTKKIIIITVTREHSTALDLEWKRMEIKCLLPCLPVYIIKIIPQNAKREKTIIYKERTKKEDGNVGPRK
jgi:hypothetical protein